MENKKEMAKLVLAGMLLTASLPSSAEAHSFLGYETYLAVADCGGGCGGNSSPNRPTVTADGTIKPAGQTGVHSSNGTVSTHQTSPNEVSTAPTQPQSSSSQDKNDEQKSDSYNKQN